MTTTEAPFSFTTKLSGDLLTVRGENVDQFANRLIELATDTRVVSALENLQKLATGGHGTAVGVVQAAMPGSVVLDTSPTIVTSTGGPEQVTDQFGNLFTYDHPDAPVLADGRGKMVFKSWRDRNGVHRKAFMDPIKGPRPCSPGTDLAPIQFV